MWLKSQTDIVIMRYLQFKKGLEFIFILFYFLERKERKIKMLLKNILHCKYFKTKIQCSYYYCCPVGKYCPFNKEINFWQFSGVFASNISPRIPSVKLK